MATWVVNVDFQAGAGWEAITSSVLLTSFVRRRQLWNKLKPTVNTLDFQLKTESSTLITKFMTAEDDILISVTKDGASYFTGMIQPNYSVEVGARIKPFDISCVDNGYRIQRRILANINWSNYKVCDPAATASSIVHQLLVAAGLATSDVYSSIVTINKTIDRFVGIAGESDVWGMMEAVLFDFGYTFYFRPDGKLDVHNFAPASISTSNAFTSDPSDTKNIIGGLKVERNVNDYEAVRVTWSTHKTLNDVLLFSDTSGGDATRKANIEISSAAYWPTDSNLRDIYADYRVEGYDLVATSAVVLVIEKDAAVTQDTFTDEILRAKVKFHNSGATSAYIRRFDIKGNAIVKDQYNVATRIMESGTNKYLDIEAQYLYSATDAELLADAVAQYYYNADMRYTLRSRSEYEPGAYVYVEETGFLGVNNLCVVQEVADVEWTGEHSYVCEGVAAYSAGSVTGTGTTERPTPYPRSNIYTLGCDGYSGFADGYLDGTADQVEINAAISQVSSVYGGGVVRVIGGTAVLSAAVELLSNVTLEIDPSATIEKNCDDYAIECVGTSGTHKSNVKISGTGMITRNASDTYAKPLVYFEYVDDSAIEGVTVDDSYDDGIYLVNCDTVSLGGALNITNCAGTGLKTLQSIIVIAAGVTIFACAIGCECFPSISTDVMYHGDCESTDEPMLDNETTPILTNCTWARSSTVSHAGTYSYKFDPSSPGSVKVTLCDNENKNDMHGVTAGKTYLLSTFALQDGTVSAPNAVRLQLTVKTSQDGATWSTLVFTSSFTDDSFYNNWKKLSTLFIVPVGTVGFEAYISGSVDDSSLNYYFDEIAMYEFDETDSGFQLVNSSISDCTDIGVSIANSQAIIQNNQITGCTNRGVEVLAGYRNILSGNRAYNNGSDTTTANDNYDNFYNAGIDTQSNGNSWDELPVAGEPSWGTPHASAATLVNGANPSDTSDTTVTCSTVPDGAKAIFGRCSQNSATAGRILSIKNTAGSTTYAECITPAATVYSAVTFVVPIDSNKQFVYSASNADMSAVYIVQLGYFI